MIIFRRKGRNMTGDPSLSETCRVVSGRPQCGRFGGRRGYREGIAPVAKTETNGNVRLCDLQWFYGRCRTPQNIRPGFDESIDIPNALSQTTTKTATPTSPRESPMQFDASRKSPDTFISQIKTVAGTSPRFSEIVLKFSYCFPSPPTN